MHDTAAFEESGLATVFVASRVFESAVEAQSESLGTSPTFVLVEHPIQDRTDAEMRSIAEASVEQLLAALTT